MVDDSYINNLVKNQVSAVFIPALCLCPSEGHKHGGRKVTETSFIQFCRAIETKYYYSRTPTC